MRGVDLQVDGTPVDSLVTSRDPCRLGFDLTADLSEVVEAAVGLVEELSEFWLFRSRLSGLLIAFDLTTAGYIDQLKDERTTGDNAGATRQEIPSDDILEHRGFPATLGADDDLEETTTISGLRASRGG